MSPNFVINFVALVDLPSPVEFESLKPKVSKLEPFIRSYIAFKNGRSLTIISEIIFTQKKYDGQSYVIFNTYRDFLISPPLEASLIVEIYHQHCSPNTLLGCGEIPISSLEDDNRRYFPLAVNKVWLFQIMLVFMIDHFLRSIYVLQRKTSQYVCGEVSATVLLQFSRPFFCFVMVNLNGMKLKPR